MINSFQGQHRFLSNFWPAVVVFEGDTYVSVEHAYQAAKTTIPALRQQINRQTAGGAKRFARTFSIRPDWDTVKIDIMTDLVRQKFQKQVLAIALQQTGATELIEGNKWHDTFWGVCNGIGNNHLGLILMQVRDELNAGYLSVSV